MAKHGAPDFYNVQPLSILYHMNDFGELAVRLGSPYMLDRRGKVIYQTSFEDGLGDWATVTAVLGSELFPVVSPVNTPPMAIEFHNMADANSLTGLFRRVPWVSLSKYGLSVVWSPPSDSYTFQIEINHYWSGNYDHYNLRYVSSTGTLEIYTPTGWVVVKTVGTLIGGSFTWYYLKMVVDIETHLYTRVLLQTDEIKVSSYAPNRTTTAQNDQLYFFMFLENGDAFEKFSFVDNVIVTAEEE